MLDLVVRFVLLEASVTRWSGEILVDVCIDIHTLHPEQLPQNQRISSSAEFTEHTLRRSRNQGEQCLLFLNCVLVLQMREKLSPDTKKFLAFVGAKHTPKLGLLNIFISRKPFDCCTDLSTPPGVRHEGDLVDLLVCKSLQRLRPSGVSKFLE